MNAGDRERGRARLGGRPSLGGRGVLGGEQLVGVEVAHHLLGDLGQDTLGQRLLGSLENTTSDFMSNYIFTAPSPF